MNRLFVSFQKRSTYFISGFIFTICLIPNISAGQTDGHRIELKTYVEQSSVPLNREVVYHVELSWPGDLNRFQISEIFDPEVSNLTVRGTGSSNKVQTDESGNPSALKRITFYFSPLELGMAYVNGVKVKYEDSQTGEAETLFAGRIEVKITEPVAEPGEGPGTIGVAGYLLLAVLVAATTYLGLRFLKNSKAKRETQPEEIAQTIEQKYLQLLHDTIHLSNQNRKDSIHDLSRLLSGYMAEKYHFPDQNLSVPDQIALLSDKGVDENLITKTEVVLGRANLIKFAGERIEESEFHQMYDAVELILQSQNTMIAEEKK